MPKTIICDISCLILLEKISKLELLHKLFGIITTTPEVAAEFGLPLPSWIVIRKAADKNYQTILEASLDKGEAIAIALAITFNDCLLIIDDLKGRKLAQKLGIAITGTISLIVNAKRKGIVHSVKPILAKMKQTNFWITENLELPVLKSTGE